MQKTNRQKAHGVRIMAPNGTVFEMDYEYGKKKQTVTSAQLLGSSGKHETIKSASAGSIRDLLKDVNSERQEENGRAIEEAENGKRKRKSPARSP